MFKYLAKAADFFQNSDVKETRAFALFWLLLGPFFLLFSLSLASYGHILNYDLWLLVCLGIFLLSKFSARGLWLALSFLALASFFKHMSIEEHAWQGALEGTIALGFLITHSSFDRISSFLRSLEAQILHQQENYCALENKLQEGEKALQQEKGVLLETLSQTQNELQALKEKHESLQGLVEALRHNAEQNISEKSLLLQEMLKRTKGLNQYKLECEKLQEEKEKLQDGKRLSLRNQELLDTLNQVRVEKYQAHLINENLARLLSKEMRKVKEANDSYFAKEQALEKNLQQAEEEVKTLHELLQESKKEQNNLCLQLEEKELAAQLLSEQVHSYSIRDIEQQAAEKELKMLNALLEETKKELSGLRLQLKEKEAAVQLLSEQIHSYSTNKEAAQQALEKQLHLVEEEVKTLGALLEETRKELSGLRQQLEEKEAAMQLLSEQLHEEKDAHRTKYLAEIGTLKRERDVLKERLEEKSHLLKSYEEKFSEARKTEACYLQLRKQFEEKNEVLHDVRAQLFQAETKLLALEKEKELSSLEEDELFIRMAKSLSEWEEEHSYVEKERNELLKVVGQLLSSSESSPKGKMTKKKILSVERQLPLV